MTLFWALVLTVRVFALTRMTFGPLSSQLNDYFLEPSLYVSVIYLLAVALNPVFFLQSFLSPSRILRLSRLLLRAFLFL